MTPSVYTTPARPAIGQTTPSPSDWAYGLVELRGSCQLVERSVIVAQGSRPQAQNLTVGLAARLRAGYGESFSAEEAR